MDDKNLIQDNLSYLYESEPVAKQPWPNHNWCVGCDSDNCSGCGTEPNERRKQASVPLEQYNKLLDALNEYAVWEIVGKGRTKIPKNYAAHAIAEAERSGK